MRQLSKAHMQQACDNTYAACVVTAVCGVAAAACDGIAAGAVVTACVIVVTAALVNVVLSQLPNKAVHELSYYASLYTIGSRAPTYRQSAGMPIHILTADLVKLCAYHVCGLTSTVPESGRSHVRPKIDVPSRKVMSTRVLDWCMCVLAESCLCSAALICQPCAVCVDCKL